MQESEFAAAETGAHGKKRQSPATGRDAELRARPQDRHLPKMDRNDDETSASLVLCQKRGAYLDETIALWQPRTPRNLTREDAREIIENVTGFFRILQEWDRADRLARDEAACGKRKG